jgi:hypothetical protein
MGKLDIIDALIQPSDFRPHHKVGRGVRARFF